MRNCWPLGAALALALFSARGPAAEPGRVIRVAGEGKAYAEPDLATIHPGVMTQASTAEEAVSANSRVMEKVRAALRQYGVAEKDVQTSQFGVNPVYRRDQDGGGTPEVTAYRVTHQVQARVRDLSKLGAVLDAVTKAGSNQLSGIRFEVANPTAVLDQARARAIADARHRAEVYARSAGVGVGAVQTISEQSLPHPQPRYSAPLAARLQSADVPVATGQEEFRVQVHMVFRVDERAARSPGGS